MDTKKGEIGEMGLMKEIYGEDRVTELTEAELAAVKPLPLEERAAKLEEIRDREARLEAAFAKAEPAGAK